MYLDYTPEQVALRDRIRATMTRLMTAELRAEIHATEGGGPLYLKAMAELGGEGWLGIGWPKAYGGQEQGPIEQFIFFDEVQRSGFPIPILTLNTVGPTLLKFGSEEQKATYPPAILRGECHFSIGYTEPGSGTDLASLSTRAVRQGDNFVINGQKIWCSLADHADYIWLACRTNPDAARHAGISIIIVPANAPGVSITRMKALGENNVNVVYFEEVVVPATNLVGPENAGWKLITTQLNHERVALNAVGPMERLIEETTTWAAATGYRNGTVLDQPWVRANLARATARLEALKLLNWQQAWNIAQNTLNPADASAIKVYGSEAYVELSRLLMEVLGAAGTLKGDAVGAAIAGDVERFYRMSLVLTFGGGTNEIQRDIIAMVGLGLPRKK